MNIQDLVLVATRLGQTGPNIADANGDGIVHILDLILVAGELGNEAGAPSIYSDGVAMLSPSEVKQWLEEARGLGPRRCHLPEGNSVLGTLVGGIHAARNGAAAELPESVQSGNLDSVSTRNRFGSPHLDFMTAEAFWCGTAGSGAAAGGVTTSDRGRAAYWDGTERTRRNGGERRLLLSIPRRGLFAHASDGGCQVERERSLTPPEVQLGVLPRIAVAHSIDQCPLYKGYFIIGAARCPAYDLVNGIYNHTARLQERQEQDFYRTHYPFA